MLCHVHGGYVINIKWKTTEFNSSLMSLHCNLENTIPSLMYIYKLSVEGTGKYLASLFHKSTFVLKTAVF